MQTVPLLPIPNQTLQINLNGQSCTINIQQFYTGLFLTLYVSNQLLLSCVICENLVRIVVDAYIGFAGDLVFNDTQGTSNPIFTGLGSRFELVYLTPADLSVLGFTG